jgi:ribosomal-protein-alanine N-acetyltransferase
MTEAIVTPRLDLVLLSPAFLAASLAGERAAAECILGAAVPDEWLEDTPVMHIFAGKLDAYLADAPWLARAMVRRDDRVMVGHCGFHGPPGDPHLDPFAKGGAEMGYTVFTPFRGNGYAAEAVCGLMGWAAARGVPAFVLSISPANAPSLAVARRLGFARVGSQIDDEDGPEDVFVRPPL